MTSNFSTPEYISIFTCSLEVLICIFLIWSATFPSKRIWPPPSRNSIKFWATWLAIGLITLGLIYIAITDFNTWILTPIARIFLGIPIFLIGVWFVGWALQVMGTKNSLGVENGLKTHGPYQFTRNPQYVGDIMILAGSILMVNSVLFIIPALLGIIGFWLMPFPEESWLKERYEESYTNYKNNTSRFI